MKCEEIISKVLEIKFISMGIVAWSRNDMTCYSIEEVALTSQIFALSNHYFDAKLVS